MDTLLSVGMSHQAALTRRMDVIANNIANASNNAFKKERVVFQSYLFEMDGEAPRDLRRVQMVLDYGVIPDMRHGDIETTSNPLDLALDGEGFFVVQNDLGERLYTRSGALRLNAEGELVTRTGERLLGVNDLPIRIGAGDVTLEIAEDGTIRSAVGEVGQIRIVRFDDLNDLRRRGDGLYAIDAPELPPDGLRIVQGALENSNVNPIEETTAMIEVLRSYQSMERSLNSYGEMRDDAVRRLSRVEA
ncbi:MAG: flagellar basal-body rod protein FlgF [Rhodothalassiaceae bacterium]